MPAPRSKRERRRLYARPSRPWSRGPIPRSPEGAIWGRRFGLDQSDSLGSKSEAAEASKDHHRPTRYPFFFFFSPNEVLCDFPTYKRRKTERWYQPERNASDKVEFGRLTCPQGDPRDREGILMNKSIKLSEDQFLWFIRNHGHLSVPYTLRTPSVSSTPAGWPARISPQTSRGACWHPRPHSGVRM